MRVARAIVAFLLVASTSAAQPDEADELKHRGDALLVERRYDEALAAYDRSYALSPNPVIHYNRGRVLQFLARFPEAVDSLERFEREAPADVRAKAPGLDELLATLRLKIATLTITGGVAGARVLVNARDSGKLPLGPLRVNAGKTTVEVLADGYFPQRREIDLAGGASAAIDVKLSPRDTFGLLVVRSNIAGTTAAVDGKPIGMVPAETAIEAGNHPVRVSHSGFDDRTTQVVMSVGERREITIDPLRRAPITSKWWFWAGIGAAVVTTVVIVIAATTEGAAPSGDFSTGQVRF